MHLSSSLLRTLFILLTPIFLFFSGCATLPENIKQQPKPEMITPTNLPYLSTLIASHPQQSGVSLIRNGIEAFLARVVMIKQAKHSLDLQYYIWKDDITGKILLSLLIEAADRGVKVRLLLDDLGSKGLDQYIQALNSHENIEIRLFNPFIYRKHILINFLSDFRRLNYRMHNKLFIMDKQVAVVGGRNIGDAYFDASPTLEFNDFDVFIIGDVMNKASQSFNAFWQNEMVYESSSIISNSSDLALITKELDTFSKQQKDTEYANALRKSLLLEELLSQNLKWFWGDVNLVFDQIEKSAPTPKKIKSIVPALTKAMHETREELLIISPYFVPGNKLVEQLSSLVRNGIRVTILTNSLASTDVTAVHAGYKNYRKKLLQNGISLYEFMPEVNAVRAKKRIFKDMPSIRSSLHAKSYIFDRNKVFIGSFNLDPRSANINSENGIIFENAELAEKVSTTIYEALDDYAYSLQLKNVDNTLGLPVEKRITWFNKYRLQQETLDEPGSHFFMSLWIEFLSLLPIENQL